jgi:hypothetical protein
MVQSISYDADSNAMVVTFNSGKSYAYAGVPEDVARDAANAASVGEFINSEIKGRYSYRRL